MSVLLTIRTESTVRVCTVRVLRTDRFARFRVVAAFLFHLQANGPLSLKPPIALNVGLWKPVRGSVFVPLMAPTKS